MVRHQEICGLGVCRALRTDGQPNNRDKSVGTIVRCFKESETKVLLLCPIWRYSPTGTGMTTFDLASGAMRHIGSSFDMPTADMYHTQSKLSPRSAQEQVHSLSVYRRISSSRRASALRNLATAAGEIENETKDVAGCTFYISLHMRTG